MLIFIVVDIEGDAWEIWYNKNYCALKKYYPYNGHKKKPFNWNKF